MNWFKRDKAEKRVRVWDFATSTVTEIPARELAPGMVQTRMDGIKGTVWVNASELHASEYRHPPFAEDIRDYLRTIKSAIEEFYPLSLEEWEDGFRRDTHPEREIAFWLHLAEIYQTLTVSRDLNVEQRRDYFQLLITCLNSPRENVLDVYSPRTISRDEARSVIAAFFGEN